MAGIGFVLRRLTRRNDLGGATQALVTATAVTSGPWLMTVLAIAGTDLWSRLQSQPWDHSTFRIVLSYDFCFSLVLTAPVVTVATRLVADQLFAGRIDRIGATYLHALGLTLMVQVPLAVLFWTCAADLPLGARLAAIACYAALIGLWVTMTCLSVLRDLKWALAAFALGMAAAVAGGVSLAHVLGGAGLVGSFAAGAAIILFIGAARILREFEYKHYPLRNVLADCRPYWQLAIVGLLTAAAPWADKWVLWLSPFGERLDIGLIDFPAYDAAMFFAYLAMVPCMALFFVVSETDFFLAYRRFFDELLDGSTLSQIESHRRQLIDRLAAAGSTLLLLQVLVTATVLLASPLLVATTLITPVQFPIFRFGLLGAFSHGLLNCALVVMSYLDVRRSQIVVVGTFLVTNALFTLALEPLGYTALGYGYVAAATVSLVTAVSILGVKFHKLLFLVFISNNPSVRAH